MSTSTHCLLRWPFRQKWERISSSAASGTSAVKYGTMRENVLAMKAVLPQRRRRHDAAATRHNATSKVVRLGCNALKSSTGYNLTALFTGSEGTLGVK